MPATSPSSSPSVDLDADHAAPAELPDIVQEEVNFLSDTRKRLAKKPPMAELDIDSIVREMARIRDEIPQAQTDERPLGGGRGVQNTYIV